MKKTRKYGARIGAEYELEVRDKHGKLIRRIRGESHSWTRWFLGLLKGQFATRHMVAIGGGNETVKDITGADQTYPRHDDSTLQTYYKDISVDCPGNDDSYGVVVGDDDTPNIADQLALNSQIAHGSGAGQLVYGAHTFESVSDADGEFGFRIIRSFTNNSGSTVTVKEIGIYARACSVEAVSFYVCLARDVLATPQSIPDGAALTVRYRAYITY